MKARHFDAAEPATALIQRNAALHEGSRIAAAISAMEGDHALLTHRKLLQSKAIAIENDLRDTLRNFSLKVGIGR